MKRARIALAILVLLLVAACTRPLPDSVRLATQDEEGIIVGRVAPVADLVDGWIAFSSSGGSFKCALDPNGYFLAKANAGTLRLESFGYCAGDRPEIVNLAAAYSFDVPAGQASYIGLVVISPLDGNVYLTDDFIRDRVWFRDKYGDKLELVSVFPNQKYYDLMERYLAVQPPTPRTGPDFADVPATTFLMGDIWPGHGVNGPAGPDLTQISPREVALPAFRLDLLPADDGAGHARANVTWTEAEAACAARGGRLPTEAEYEIAARGPRWGERYYALAPAVTSGRTPGAGDAPVLAETDRWPAGPYGARFNAAALAEWTADAAGGAHILRAGPYRFAAPADTRSPGLGFRCAFPVVAPDRSAAPAPIETRLDAALYAGPNYGAAVVGQAPAGTPVEILGQSGDFYLVRLPNGDEAFIEKSRAVKGDE